MLLCTFTILDIFRDLFQDMVKLIKDVIVNNFFHQELHRIDSSRHLILVFDECFYDSSWQRSTGIRTAVYNGKTLNISIIFCLQHAMGLSIGIRNNVDYVAVFRDHTISDRKRLYEYFFTDLFNRNPRSSHGSGMCAARLLSHQ